MRVYAGYHLIRGGNYYGYALHGEEDEKSVFTCSILQGSNTIFSQMNFICFALNSPLLSENG